LDIQEQGAEDNFQT